MKFLKWFTLSLGLFMICSVGAIGQSIYGSLTADQITGAPLNTSDQSAVILIHGWNPNGDANPFAGGGIGVLSD